MTMLQPVQSAGGFVELFGCQVGPCQPQLIGFVSWAQLHCDFHGLNGCVSATARQPCPTQNVVAFGKLAEFIQHEVEALHCVRQSLYVCSLLCGMVGGLSHAEV